MGCWSSSQQVCASCRYWRVRRDIDFMAQFYTTEGDTEGKCANPQGGFRGVSMSEGASCSDWEGFNKE